MRRTSQSATRPVSTPAKSPGGRRLRKTIGEKIDWRRFNSGPEVVTAIASGDVQIGNLGSSPLAAAASRNLPIVAFIVSAQINAAEAWWCAMAASINRKI
jgi:taurine transport system substrate-binding protein